MYTFNCNPNRTEHIHVRTKDHAAILLACLVSSQERIVFDEEETKRTGYTVQSIRLDELRSETETAVVYHRDHRFEVFGKTTGATTMIWWEED